MASCPAIGSNVGGSPPFQITLGPFSNKSGVSSYTLLDGKCTLRTSGINPYKSSITSTAGQSMVAFIIPASGYNMLSFSSGDIIIINELPYEIISIINSTTIIVSDVNAVLPAYTPAQWNDLPFFEKILDGDINAFTYQYALAATDGTITQAYASIAGLINETFANETGNFTIVLQGSSPIGYALSVPWYPLATYHFDESIILIDSVVSVPDGCVGLECADPFSVSGGVSIEVACDVGAIYNPYAQNKSVNLYKQLNNIVSDVFGHTVNYFRTEPHARTKDVTLLEYSLHGVSANQEIKILVPDNEFPTNAATFDIFGMEFEEFEVHVVHDRFKAVFGDGIRPRERDYMFIPIINKMYEVNSVAIADEFNAARSYWRLKLTKYQDRTSVIKDIYAAPTDALITGIDEVFGEEISDEQAKDTNPVQFQTVSRILTDGSRIYINAGLTIVDEAIVNNFQTVSHNHYDLSKVTSGDIALRYSTATNMIIDGQIAVSAWFRPTFEITDAGNYFLISDQLSSGGFDITINTLEINVIIDGLDHKFTHNTSLSKTKWYGIVVNIMNNTEQVELMLYSLSETGHVSSLVQEYHEVKTMNGGQQYWTSTSPYVIKGGKLNITSLRIFDKAIGILEMPNILNQYVVHDNQHALVIDNAIPSLGYQKFKNAR